MPSHKNALLIALTFFVLLFIISHSKIIADSTANEEAQIAAMEQAIKDNSDLATLFSWFGDPKRVLQRFNKGKEKAEKQWQEQQASIQKIKNMGTTQSLEIIPLIDWHTKNERLKGEAGISYLIKTDHSTILFDVGLNSPQSDPSPLLSNMKELGIKLDDIDTIVISHNHGDHVGGGDWSRQRTFSLTSHQIDLGSKTVYTPVPMTYPGLSPVLAQNPTKICNGVTTIGTITNRMFFTGLAAEQALAANVKGKGIVLIVGCGHQKLIKLLERVSALFDEPIYGFIGGLHYPVTDSRLVFNGIKAQMYFGTGKVPWEPITLEEVDENTRLLKKYHPGIVRLSGHDSCDASLAVFRRAFPKIYDEVRVGERVVIKTQ